MNNIVKAHIQVQSVVEKGVVSRLSYLAKGPFMITKNLGNNSFEVQQYGKLDNAVRKYRSTVTLVIP